MKVLEFNLTHSVADLHTRVQELLVGAQEGGSGASGGGNGSGSSGGGGGKGGGGGGGGVRIESPSFVLRAGFPPVVLEVDDPRTLEAAQLVGTVVDVRLN